jgi:Fungal specific transcription factor domain
VQGNQVAVNPSWAGPKYSVGRNWETGTGNKPSGRKCVACRARRRKVIAHLSFCDKQCVFKSQFLPCKFCRTMGIKEPCVKLWGPLREAPFLPSRPFPTASDTVVNVQDVHLLQYAYSDVSSFNCLHRALFRVFSAQYGQAISSLSLRHAVLALAAGHLRSQSSNFHRISLSHRGRALRFLIQSLKGPAEMLSDADLFTSMILALDAFLFGDDNRDVLVLTAGCSEMLLFLNNKTTMQPISDTLLSVFGPLAHDVVTQLASHSSISRLSYTDYPRAHRSAFKDQLKYSHALTQFYDRSHPVFSSGLAIHESLVNAFKLLTRCIDRIGLTPEDWQKKTLSHPLVTLVLAQIEAEFADLDFRNKLQELQSLGLIGRLPQWEGSESETSLETVMFLLGTWVHLANDVLPQESLLPDFVSMALEIVSHCNERPPTPADEHLRHESNFELIFGALALPTTILEPRNYSIARQK